MGTVPSERAGECASGGGEQVEAWQVGEWEERYPPIIVKEGELTRMRDCSLQFFPSGSAWASPPLHLVQGESGADIMQCSGGADWGTELHPPRSSGETARQLLGQRGSLLVVIIREHTWA